MADKNLIKQVANEFKWTQADLNRAIAASQDVTTRDG
jgi:DNA-binding XRE family transcriptional regulator